MIGNSLRAALVDVDDEIGNETGKNRLAADEDEQDAEHQQRPRANADALCPEARQVGQHRKPDDEERRADAPKKMQAGAACTS